MKKIMIGVLCLLCIQCFAQDTTKAKPKAWLGVLTLTEKYKTEANWTGQDQGIVGEHFQRLIKMKEAGKVILAGRTELALDNPDMMGLVIFYAKDEKEAQQFMQDDPAVKNKIMLAKVHPYGLALIKCE
jgi:uncharacterized protein YciI